MPSQKNITMEFNVHALVKLSSLPDLKTKSVLPKKKKTWSLMRIVYVSELYLIWI